MTETEIRTHLALWREMKQEKDLGSPRKLQETLRNMKERTVCPLSVTELQSSAEEVAIRAHSLFIEKTPIRAGPQTVGRHSNTMRQGTGTAVIDTPHMIPLVHEQFIV